MLIIDQRSNSLAQKLLNNTNIKYSKQILAPGMKDSSTYVFRFSKSEIYFSLGEPLALEFITDTAVHFDRDRSHSAPTIYFSIFSAVKWFNFFFFFSEGERLTFTFPIYH